jgi:putative ABC transport system substrate-binding protein
MTSLSRRAVVGGLAGLGVSAAGLALVNACGSLPFAAQPRLARIGHVWSGSPVSATLGAGFRDGLRDAGWIDGQNAVIDERHSGGDPERIPHLAAELVALSPDVLLAGSDNVVLAYLRATDSIPIVYAAADRSSIAGDLRDVLGPTAGYARPANNVTGTFRASGGSLGPKLLDLLRQLVPGLARVAVVYTLFNPQDVTEWLAVQAAAQPIGIDAQAVAIASPDDVEGTLDACLAGQPQALISSVNSGLIISATNQPATTVIMDFALQHALPTASDRVGTPSVGCLLYYGPDLVALFRRAGSFHADRILRGTRPADLPWEGATVYQLIVNRTTARALGIAIPPDLAIQVTDWVD